MNIIFKQETEGCNQETVEFKVIKLFEEPIDIYIPNDMELMTKEKRDIYFPYECSPSYILSNFNENVIMSFQILHPYFKKDIFSVVKSAYQLIEEQYPLEWISPPHLFCKYGYEVPILWFLMDLKNSKERKNHLKYMTVLKNKLLLGTITYQKNEFDKWQSIVKYMFEAMIVLNNGYRL